MYHRKKLPSSWQIQMTKSWTQQVQLLRAGITNRGINLHIKLYPSSLLKSNMGAKPFEIVWKTSQAPSKKPIDLKHFPFSPCNNLVEKKIKMPKQTSYTESWLCYSAGPFSSSWQQHHSWGCWRDSPCCDLPFYKSCEWYKARILVISAACWMYLLYLLQGEKIHRFSSQILKLPRCRPF